MTNTSKYNDIVFNSQYSNELCWPGDIANKIQTLLQIMYVKKVLFKI